MKKVTFEEIWGAQDHAMELHREDGNRDCVVYNANSGEFEYHEMTGDQHMPAVKESDGLFIIPMATERFPEEVRKAGVQEAVEKINAYIEKS